MQGYLSATTAAAAAKRRRAFGLDGSGQQCCPVQLPDSSWAFWTAHDYYHPQRHPGALLLPQSRQIDLADLETVEALFGPYFIREELGLWPPSWITGPEPWEEGEV